MQTRTILLFFLLFSSYLCKAQEIIPYPNHYEQREGTLNVPKVVTVSASGDFATLIPEFVQTAKKLSVQAKEKGEKRIYSVGLECSII